MASNSSASPSFLVKAVRYSLGWAVAITLVHLVQGIGLIVALGMPPLTGFAAQSVVFELTLAMVVGMVLSPLAMVRSPWAHSLGAAAVTIGLERYVAVDPSKPQMWIGPTIGALVVLGIGRALWRRKPPVVVGLALVIPAIALSVPLIVEAQRPPEKIPESKTKAPAGAPDVLFIVMDTVRAQSSGTYGYERKTTPTLDTLAQEGVVFLDANAPATWSLPAHAALFTGTFPSWNGAHAETRMLDTRLPTLAEQLADAGWQTRCFSANPHISPSFGLTRGFQANDKAWMTGTSGRSFSFIYRLIDLTPFGGATDKGGAMVVDNVRRWMDTRPKDGPPQFVFVNFLEAHFPFHQLPSDFLFSFQNLPMSQLRDAGQISFGVQFGRQLTDAEYDQVHQPLKDMYDAGVLYTDHLVGEVVDMWRKRGLLDNTVVVVLGDHGESMGEHRAFGHVTPITEEILRVPFVMRYPAKIPAGSRVTEPVTTVGVSSTLFDLLDLDVPNVHQVSSLMPALNGEIVGKPILAERFEEHMLSARFAPGTANGTGPEVTPFGRFRTYRSGPYKLVQHTTDGTFLFNLEEDPGELHDLAPEHPEIVIRIKDELDAWKAKLGLPELDAEVGAPMKLPENMKPEEIEALRALGYIE